MIKKFNQLYFLEDLFGFFLLRSLNSSANRAIIIDQINFGLKVAEIQKYKGELE